MSPRNRPLDIKNEGASGDIDENKGGGVRCQDTSASSTSIGDGHGILSPRSCPSKNEGVSGDLYENLNDRQELAWHNDHVSSPDSPF